MESSSRLQTVCGPDPIAAFRGGFPSGGLLP